MTAPRAPCVACGTESGLERQTCSGCGRALGGLRGGATLVGVPIPSDIVTSKAALPASTLIGIPLPSLSAGAGSSSMLLREAPSREAPSREAPIEDASTSTEPDLVPPQQATQRTLMGIAPVYLKPAPGPQPAPVPTAPRPAVGKTGAAPEAAAPDPKARTKQSASPARRAGAGATELLRQEAAELVAVARIAAATAETERDAQRRRIRKVTWVLGLIGLTALVFSALVYRSRHAFEASVVGTLDVRRGGTGYAVSVGLSASRPAQVFLPAGAVPEGPLEAAGTIHFQMPEAAMAVGDNRLKLRVVPKDDPTAARELGLQIKVYYRIEDAPTSAPTFGLSPAPSSGPTPVPTPGSELEFRLRFVTGFTAAVAHATSRAGPSMSEGALIQRFVFDADFVRAQLDAAPPDARHIELPIELRLERQGAPAENFSERLRVAVTPIPVVLNLPLLGQVHGAVVGRLAGPLDLVVEGRTRAGASLELGDVRGTAGADGHFRLIVPAGFKPGSARLLVDAPAQPAVSIEINFNREAPPGTPDVSQLRRLAKKAAPLPYKAATLGKVTGEFRVEGIALSALRGTPDSPDRLQLATCSGGCPVWLEVEGPSLMRLGDRVVSVGRLNGVLTYTSRDGRALPAPLLRVPFVVSR